METKTTIISYDSCFIYAKIFLIYYWGSVSMVELKTLTKGSFFRYESSIKNGIKIMYGNLGYYTKVSQEILQLLIKKFSDKTVLIETTRTIANLNEGSLGHWLNKHLSSPVITSYVAAILVHEGYAEFCDKKLKFKIYQPTN